ncbi:VOC family protein [Actinacidiphila glaucinigra]|uniref:VOC family protein n=1 Tax=Actinacidiphila glaucinigra TaxID=235986 RepID=UPI003407618D
MLSTDYVPGAPNWLDLGTPDVDASVAYYREVFGWDHLSAGPEAGGYGMFRIAGRTVAGIGPNNEPGVTTAAWEPFFQTADADATTKSVEQAGGGVRFSPMDVFDLGRMAAYADPTGARFCVWQPGENKGLDVVDEPGTLYWTELFTTDAPTALAFYRSVFDWRTEDSGMPGAAYTLVSPAGGGESDAHGGVMQLDEQMLAAGAGAHWLPYFEVTDCDATLAKAVSAGGTIRVPATEVPEVGRFAQVVDTQGAAFGVITPPPSAG